MMLHEKKKCLSVHSFSCVQLYATSLSITNSWSLLKLMSVELAIQSSHPLLSPSPPTINLSQHQGLLQ